MTEALLLDQACTIYDAHTPEGKRAILSAPTCQRGAEHPNVDLLRVNICIPTRNLEPYLSDTVARLCGTIEADLQDLRSTSQILSVVVLSNGEVQAEGLRRFVHRFLIEHSFPVSVTLIHTATPGKSNALNLLHRYAVTTGAGQLLFMDDDVNVAPGVLPKVYRRLIDGSPAFLGAPTRPSLPALASQACMDIYRMTLAKRNEMGFPMPIGRFMALPTAIFPVITDDSVNDDVFLSSHFFQAGMPQEVLDLEGVTYSVSHSLSEFIKRKRRISTSDQRIVALVPEIFRTAFYRACIAPRPISTLTDADRAWRRIEEDLYSFAKAHVFSAESKVDLTETDLSTKPGTQHQHAAGEWDGVLKEELARLKDRHLRRFGERV